VNRITLSLLAAAVITIGAPPAQAMTLCTQIPAMCPAQNNPGSGSGNSAPEPGTLGLLAMGAAASIGMLRRKKR
jgi:hypothetical protein